MEVSTSINFFVRQIVSRANVQRYYKVAKNRTVFEQESFTSLKDTELFQQFKFRHLHTFIQDNTLTNWTMYSSICRPTYCTVTKPKGLHSYVLETLAAVGGLSTLALFLVRALWSGIVYVNVRAGYFEDVVEDESTNECSTGDLKTWVPLREKFSGQGASQV